MSDPKIRVSDHALVRYMERVLGMDVEQLRGMLQDACARHQGAPCVRTLGARFLIREGRVVTILAGNEVPHFDVLVDLSRERGGA